MYDRRFGAKVAKTRNTPSCESTFAVWYGELEQEASKGAGRFSVGRLTTETCMFPDKDHDTPSTKQVQRGCDFPSADRLRFALYSTTCQICMIGHSSCSEQQAAKKKQLNSEDQ